MDNKTNGCKLLGLKKERERQHVTQAELARVLGVTPQYISALERGLNELTYYDAYIIAKYLKVHPDDIFLEDAKQRKQQEIELWEQKDKERMAERKKIFDEMLQQQKKS